jgi:hypothetical protein
MPESRLTASGQTRLSEARWERSHWCPVTGLDQTFLTLPPYSRFPPTSDSWRQLLLFSWVRHDRTSGHTVQSHLPEVRLQPRRFPKQCCQLGEALFSHCPRGKVIEVAASHYRNDGIGLA